MRLCTLALIACCTTLTLDCEATTESVEEQHLASTPIVGGKTASLATYPGATTLLIVLPEFGPVTCGGTLIADGWVLTAAHCLSPEKTDGGVFLVEIGREDRRTGDGEEQCAGAINMSEAARLLHRWMKDRVEAAVGGWDERVKRR